MGRNRERERREGGWEARKQKKEKEGEEEREKERDFLYLILYVIVSLLLIGLCAIYYTVKKNGEGLGVPSHEVDVGGGGGVSNKVYTKPESEFVFGQAE